MTEQEITAGIEELAQGFMAPDICFFEADPEAGSYQEPNDPRAEDRGAGWYARLSANGYLDCTDWSGPFETELEAAEDLVSMYLD